MIVILSLYILVILVFAVISLLALYQLWQFAFVGDQSLRVIVIYVLASLAIIVGSFIMLFASQT